jgi:hypothetical protein
MDSESLGELVDRGSARAPFDEILDLWGSEAGLLLHYSMATARGSITALSAISQGRDAGTRPFRV